MMTSDHISFRSPTSSSSNYDKAEQHVGSTPIPAQHEYYESWTSLDFDDPTSFSSQGWTWPYNSSSTFTQDVANPIHQIQAVPDQLLDLGQPGYPGQSSSNREAANKVDVQSLIKPVAEGWRPPYLPSSGNVSHGYHSSVYARSTGVMTEPLLDEETSSIVGSDIASTFDSNFLSTGAYHNPPFFRQDVIRDDRSEISATSGARAAPASTRPPAGRTVSDSQVIRHNSRRRPSQPLPVCEYCNAFWPKNRSDQIKHERKHTKPFKCRHAECVVKDVGFSTENDRDRHYKSGRHHEAPTKGALKGFICIACTDSKSKWWPRQDNFKAHCNRRHTTWNIDNLMKQSERAVRPSTAYSKDNNTTFSDPTYQQQTFPQHEYNGAYDLVPVRQGEEDLWFDNSASLPPINGLAGVGQALQLADAFTGRAGSIDTTVLYGWRREPRYAAMQFASMDLMSPSDPSRLLLGNGLSHPVPLEVNDSSGFLKAEGHGLKVQSTPSPVSAQSPVDTSDGEGPFKCTQCSKTKRRRCEIKKHMKRHTRPYLCTFPDCGSRHGSRSDWKRHEESQHPLQESWKCTARVSNGSGCFADLISEEELQRHLIVKHGMSAVQVSPEFCEHMHLGDNATGRYWCPFCRSIIVTESKSSCDWREMRLQHIGDHFDKQD